MSRDIFFFLPLLFLFWSPHARGPDDVIIRGGFKNHCRRTSSRRVFTAQCLASNAPPRLPGPPGSEAERPALPFHCRKSREEMRTKFGLDDILLARARISRQWQRINTEECELNSELTNCVPAPPTCALCLSRSSQTTPIATSTNTAATNECSQAHTHTQ